jgi:hypothetical protein
MSVSNITILAKQEIDKKQQAAQALLRIDELGLWRDEAVSFDAYREKFKEVLEDLNITNRHLNRLIAAEKCVEILRPTGLEVPTVERQIRPLTQLKEPKQIIHAYKRSLDIAQSQGESLNCTHVQKAVEEIKPPKVRLPKAPRPPIGATVQILPHYPDEELHGAEGVVAQHPLVDRCIVRFGDENSKLIPDNMLFVVDQTTEFTSVKEEGKAIARSLGLKTGLQAPPDIERNEGIPTETQQLETEIAVAAFLRILPRLSQWQKGVIYEQLMKSGFKAGVAA